jgi:hypothetical protein
MHLSAVSVSKDLSSHPKTLSSCTFVALWAVAIVHTGNVEKWISYYVVGQFWSDRSPVFSIEIIVIIILLAFTTHLRVLASSILRFQDHNDTTQSVGLLWTSDRPVAETSTWQTHNTYNRQTSMPSARFEPAIPAGDRSQTYALDRAFHWDRRNYC